MTMETVHSNPWAHFRMWVGRRFSGLKWPFAKARPRLSAPPMDDDAMREIDVNVDTLLSPGDYIELTRAEVLWDCSPRLRDR